MFLPLIGIQIADSDNFSFGVILLGMLVGTFMTITNGSGRIIQLLYKIRLEKNTLKKLREDTVISAVIQKSFWDAVKTPSISYEEDKIISMVYFCIIIVLIIFNVVNDTHLFAEQFQSNEDMILMVLATFLAISGFMVYYNTFKNAPNFFKKLDFVTMNLFYANLRNWQIELKNVSQQQQIFYASKKQRLRYPLFAQMAKKNISNDEELKDFLSNDNSYHDYLLKLCSLDFNEGGEHPYAMMIKY